MASTGNATDFGDLTQARGEQAGASTTTRMIVAGGSTPSQVNTIDYVEIATVGNAVDFGDLTYAVSGVQGSSAAHGGLQ